MYTVHTTQRHDSSRFGSVVFMEGLRGNVRGASVEKYNNLTVENMSNLVQLNRKFICTIVLSSDNMVL